MNDFFDDLGGHLHRAARRRARGRRAARLVPLLMLPLAIAAVVALAADPEPEREVARPAPAGCVADLRERFAVLSAKQRPVPQRVRRLLEMSTLEVEIDSSAARLARTVHGRQFWVAPGCLDATEPRVCLLLAEPGRHGLSCASPSEIRSGDLEFREGLSKGEFYLAALLPDDETEAAVRVGGERREGSVENNVFYVEYAATADEAGTVEFVLDEEQNLHSPDTDRDAAPEDEPTGITPIPGRSCDTTADSSTPAPPEIVDRFPVLQRARTAPVDLDLFGDPQVRTVWPKAGRTAAFPSGLRAVLVPVELGECDGADPQPGVCLVPVDGPHACAPVHGGPQIVAVKVGNEHDETSIFGVTTADVRRVIVATPARPLDVEAEAGTITATVPEPDPEKVTVRPAQGG